MARRVKKGNKKKRNNIRGNKQTPIVCDTQSSKGTSFPEKTLGSPESTASTTSTVSLSSPSHSCSYRLYPRTGREPGDQIIPLPPFKGRESESRLLRDMAARRFHDNQDLAKEEEEEEEEETIGAACTNEAVSARHSRINHMEYGEYIYCILFDFSEILMSIISTPTYIASLLRNPRLNLDELGIATPFKKLFRTMIKHKNLSYLAKEYNDFLLTQIEFIRNQHLPDEYKEMESGLLETHSLQSGDSTVTAAEPKAIHIDEASFCYIFFKQWEDSKDKASQVKLIRAFQHYVNKKNNPVQGQPQTSYLPMNLAFFLQIFLTLLKYNFSPTSPWAWDIKLSIFDIWILLTSELGDGYITLDSRSGKNRHVRFFADTDPATEQPNLLGVVAVNMSDCSLLHPPPNYRDHPQAIPIQLP